MCGIAGWLSWDEGADLDKLSSVINSMYHRGPDAGGMEILGPIALAHRRLSILDCAPTNNQPLRDQTGKFWIVFNGEIYNFLHIKKQLESTGSQFKTQGDTEVILEAYKQWGERCLQKLQGMFAFGIWDVEKKQLFLARDRLGEKPLFYATPNSHSFVFASEPQALRRFVPGCNTTAPAGLIQYLSLNYTTGNINLLAGIKRLPPAHFMIIEEGGETKLKPYWDLAYHFLNKRTFSSEKDAVESLDSLLAESVKSCLVSDVPLGAFLSGGLDSSSIVAAMARLNDPRLVNTFSIGFKEGTFNELTEARAAASFIGVDHHDAELTADPNLFLNGAIRAAAEPIADSSFLPTFCLAKFARERVTVALSGDGGDECFAGYETYVADLLHQNLSKLPSWLLERADYLSELLPVRFTKVSLDYKLRQFSKGLLMNHRTAHYSWRNIFSQSDLKSILQPDWLMHMELNDPFEEFEKHYEAVKDCHPLDQAMYVDMKTWLPDDILVKVDRSAMASSLETRAPFLNHQLVEFAASLPIKLKIKNFRKKHILKESQKQHLPSWLINRPKRGFNAPVSSWFAGPLNDLAKEALHQRHMADWFKPEGLSSLLREHESGRRDNGLRLFGLTILSFWLSQP